MEQSSINVFERISAEYYNLTTAEKKAADYVLSHQRKAQDMSISELAAASGVAEATVSRFCRRLGCKGYNAFRLAIANSIAQRPQQSNPLSGEVLDDDSFSDVCKKLYTANVSAMTQTLELVRPEEYIRAADLLEQADRVLCMGQGGSMIIAMEAAHLFSTASGKFFSVTDSHMQAIAIATAGENDVILFFSYSGSDRNSLLRARARPALHSRHTLCQLSRRRSCGCDAAVRRGRKPAAARLRRREDRADVPSGRSLFRALPPQSGRMPPEPRPHRRRSCG